MPRTKLTIEGMSCGHCVMAVRNALESLPGVGVEDVVIGSAIVTFDDPALYEQIQGAIEEEEFKLVARAAL